ncbi:hypothetical protein AAH991_00330 [Microbispora sp. ZYX-F-249]|uniref:WD40 repeat domain-containing protein n=1 Tax=Microbispora maris TaxID=3144104 RepID=A0ABV0AEL1_9ACTN
MNDVIRRLQDAAHAVGETVDAVPPFVPATTPVRRRTRVGAVRGRTWLMPLAAAAAVTLAVAGGAAVARHGGGTGDTAAGIAVGPAAAPAFLAHIGDPGDITIRSVTDGHSTDVVPRPATDEGFSAVQATRDNRVFYAATISDGCRSRLYQFTLDGEGRVASHGELPYAPPEGTEITALAVSGDGATLAYGLSSCEPEQPRVSLVVTDTATGGSRTWTSTRPGSIRDLSLTEDGRRVLLTRATGTVFGISNAPRPSMSEPPDSGAEPSPVATASSAPDAETSVATESASADPAATPAGTEAGVAAGREAGEPAGTETGAPLAPDSGAPGEAGASPVPSAPDGPGADVAVPASDLPGSLPEGWGCRARSTGAEPSGSPDATPDAKIVWTCSGSQTPALLDTGVAGTLDDARVIALTPTTETPPALILGVTITPDGSRVIAAQTTLNLSTAGEDAMKYDVDGIVAYDLEGRQIDVLHARGGRGVIPTGMLDVDGTGRNLLVSRAGELGEITTSGYRTLYSYGIPPEGAPVGRVAW